MQTALLLMAPLLLALAGHMFLWIGLINRFNAIGARRIFVKTITRTFFAVMVALPIGLAAWTAQRGGAVFAESLVLRCYLGFCWCLVIAVPVRLLWLRMARQPPAVRFHGRRRIALRHHDVTATEEHRHHPFSRLPGNEVLELDLNQWTLDMPRLDAALDGLTLAHLSDLHFTGRIGKSHFCEVVRVTNEQNPDLIAITGDVVDHAECIGWIAETLGHLTARYGVYFVLGNHDTRVDVPRLRGVLTDCGLVDLGGRWRDVAICGRRVILAGNEAPWFGSAPDLGGCSAQTADRPFRIALSHTPDQFAWARLQDIDLLLAGHTHGGQIRIPPLGAIFSPTLDGVKYVSGVFQRKPTILHVTRGVSGAVPLRFNCRPEVALLKLRSPRQSER